MADRRVDGGNIPQRFVEEIDFSEINCIGVSFQLLEIIIGEKIEKEK